MELCVDQMNENACLLPLYITALITAQKIENWKIRNKLAYAYSNGKQFELRVNKQQNVQMSNMIPMSMCMCGCAYA